MRMFQKILLAADGSEHAYRAAQKAAHLASIEGGARITLLYVIDPSSSKHDIIAEGSSRGRLNDIRHQRVKQIEDLFERKEVSFQYQTLKGEPGPTIVEYANHEDYDVIIIGSRGLNALQEFVLGSVSHKVMKRANCPVMVVK